MKDGMPKIGDRIKMKQDIFVGFDRAYNALGTIVQTNTYALCFYVEFDENIDGHNCAGNCKDGHGWFVKRLMFNIIREKYYPSVVTNIIGAH